MNFQVRYIKLVMTIWNHIIKENLEVGGNILIQNKRQEKFTVAIR